MKKNKIPYLEGTNISVPAVTFQLPHANTHYQKIQPATVEMELAACLSRAKDIGIRAVGCLIISDNRNVSIGNEKKRKLRREAKTSVLQLFIEHIAAFQLPPLHLKKRFSIDQHLASIIEDPNDMANIYRRSKRRKKK